MACGGCYKRGQILKQAGAALRQGHLNQASRRLSTVAASAAKSAAATMKSAINVRRPK